MKAIEKQNLLNEEMKQEKKMLYVFLIGFFFMFMMFFKYVSIGDKIAQEVYTINGEVDFDSWFWNIGIFIAIMMGFERMLSFIMGVAFPEFEE